MFLASFFLASNVDDFAFLTWIVSTIAATVIAAQKCAGLKGFFAGLFLGPLGALVAFSLDARPRCRTCGGRVDMPVEFNPRLCPHCHTKLDWSGGNAASKTQSRKSDVAIAEADFNR
jgi:hypothetical protein